jgi:hypothetical protein
MLGLDIVLKRLLVGAGAVLALGRAGAQSPDPCIAARALVAAGPAPRVVTPAEVCRVLSVLAHDSMEGRMTASRGAAKAARFIAQEFRTAGLEPAGDSGYFQRVPVVMTRRPNGVVTPAAVPSFAARDTFPPERRGSDVNVLGILRGADPVLRDSVVLVDAHFDHEGVRAGGPVDVDSMRAWQALAAPVLAEREAWFESSGINARAARGAMQMPDAERATMTAFGARIQALRVNMDSVRRAHPVARLDSIYNGADDDASGVTAVIEIARQLAAGPRPKRTVIFAATTGEEIGLVGTRWYIAHPVVPNTMIEANLEIEMIGRPDSLAGGAGRGWLTGFERSTMGDIFAAAGLPIVPDKRLDQNFFMRSDNIAFARMGIPAHTLSSFNLHGDYHQVTDEISAVDFAHMAGVINAAVEAVRLLANRDAPHWKPGGQPRHH